MFFYQHLNVFKYKVKVVHVPVHVASSGAAKTCTNMKTFFGSL